MFSGRLRSADVMSAEEPFGNKRSRKMIITVDPYRTRLTVFLLIVTNCYRNFIKCLTYSLKYVTFCYRKGDLTMLESIKTGFNNLSIKTKQKLFLITSSSLLTFFIVECFGIVATAA